MKTRLLVAATLFAVTMQLFAFERGQVLLKNQAFSRFSSNPFYRLWEFDPRAGVNYTFAADATALIYDLVPYGVEGHFIVPSPDRVVFHYRHTVSWWNGQSTSAFDSDKGYTDIFTDDVDLGDIVALRDGRFVVAERSGANLIEFDLSHRIADHPFSQPVVGVEHLEVLADQCTVLYTSGNLDPAGNRVRRMNFCTNQSLPDFATLLPGEYAGAIRQLPNGDVLVANGSAVLRFNSAGEMTHSYAFPGVTHIALSDDGKSFYAAGVDTTLNRINFVRYAPVESFIAIGNPGMTSLDEPTAINDLVTVGEWRAATAAAPRLRAVHH